VIHCSELYVFNLVGWTVGVWYKSPRQIPFGDQYLRHWRSSTGRLNSDHSGVKTLFRNITR